MAVYCERLSLRIALYCMKLSKGMSGSAPRAGRASRPTMTNGGSSSDAPLLPLSYAMHSGGGVQLQALTNAIFLANATAVDCMCRPGSYNNMSRSCGTRRVSRRKCKTPYIDMSKQRSTH